MKKYVDDATAIGIIGGADGPTAIFMTGPAVKLPLRARVRNCVYQIKRRWAEKRITPGTHSLREVTDYAMEQYHAVEADPLQQSFLAQKNTLKEYLIFRNQAAHPDTSGDAYEIPMDFHIYEISQGDSSLEIAIDYVNDSFGISYCGRKKPVKHFKKITKDLYRYYGVSEEDIKHKTERYHALLGVLSR